MESLKRLPVEEDPIIERTILLERMLRETHAVEEKNAAEVALMSCCFFSGNLAIERQGKGVVLTTKEIPGGILGIYFSSDIVRARFWRDRNEATEDLEFQSPVKSAEILFRDSERSGCLLFELENGNSWRIEPDPATSSNVIKYFHSKK